jgi:uncharacterized OB-fold protein
MSDKSAIRENSEPFSEGLFVVEDETAFLIGSKCATCGQAYFPACSRCFECDSETMEPLKFGHEGTLYSYAVSHMASNNFDPPYAAGWIDVAEGLRVFAPIRLKEGCCLKVGAELVLSIRELWRQNSKSMMGYTYEPR